MLLLVLSLLFALGRAQADQSEHANATDSGGDSCSYYEGHRHHCGCCNTPDFSSSNCLACQSPLPLGNVTWWTWVFQTWPRKARELRLPRKRIEGSIPTDVAERWPHLTHIDLSYNRLVGELPRQLGDLPGLVSLELTRNELNGTLPPELGNLRSLERLMLTDNHLSGRLPSELGNLTNLKVVGLTFNQLSGGLPPELGNLRSLEFLYVDGNQLSGALVPELGNLKRLLHLSMGHNLLNGSLPLELGRLTSLQSLILDSNQLSGSLPPELGNLAWLQTLHLTHNLLSGNLPEELGNLKELHGLYLNDNQLSGGLPRELGNLEELWELDLAGNQLRGSLPRELGNLRWLEGLHLQNNQFSGVLPPDLGSLTDLVSLHLHNNHFSGTLPHEFGNLTGLRELSLNDNQLSGSIPAELGNLRTLISLGLGRNQLSGSIPAEFGNLLSLTSLDLDNNQLSSLPPELGNLGQLEFLRLSNNQLVEIPGDLGNLASLLELHLQNNLLRSLPPEISNLWSLSRLYLDGNQLSSLPPELGNLVLLEHLQLSNNQLLTIPTELGNLANLQELQLHHNLLRSLPPWRLGGLLSLTTLELQNNMLRALPPEIGNLMSLQTLKLQNNLLDSLPPEIGNLFSLRSLHLQNNLLRSLPQRLSRVHNLRSLYLQNNLLHGGVPQEIQQLWTLHVLDLSANKLSGDIPEWLLQMYYIQELYLQKNLLQGSLSRGHFPTLRILNVSANWLSGSVEPDWWPSLTSLDLSGNRITAVLGSPPPQLAHADFRGNALTTLDEGWWTRGALEGRFLRVHAEDNPELRLPVQFEVDGICPGVGVRELRAHPRDWSERPGTASECTSLCPLANGRLLLDGTVNESRLCRCREGQGVGLNCSPCSCSSCYSSLTAEDGYFRRTCLECPVRSILPPARVECFADCLCSQGSYMAQLINGSAQDVGTTPCDQLASEGQCQPCGIFKTSQQGSRKQADCFCNSNPSNGGWAELLEKDGQCGCPEGFHMNFVQRGCVPCRIEEDCGDWTRSLAPPRVRAGFWAAPPPPRASDGSFGNFSQHSIWRCQSALVCPGDSSCAWNRTGTACSLCKWGHFATFSGRCEACSMTYLDTRRLLAAALLACTAIPVIALLQLKTDTGEPSGLALALHPVRTSIKQILKFAQIMGLLSLFHVEWPPAGKSTLGAAQVVSLDVAAFVGVACLDAQQQQSMTLELVFRWMLPLAGMAITCIAGVVVAASGRFLGPVCIRCRPSSKAKIQLLSSFQALDVIRVLLFFLHLFFPSLLKNALMPLTCSPSPNGLLTMNAFPHQVCWSVGAESTGSFWWAAGVGLAQSVLLSMGFPLLLYFAWKRVKASRTSSVLRQRRRWWAFLFTEFRPHRMSWALVAVCKDILLNLVVVLLPGLGTAQLLVTAVVSIAYACRVFCVSPYPDASNSILETCLSAAVASLCLFSAGMGFQSESDIPDLGAYVADGREGPGYVRRAITLVCLQGLSLLAPATILTFQLLVAFPVTRRRVPGCLLPWSPQRRSEWSQDFSRVVGLDRGPLPRALQDFDDIEFSAFRRAVLESPVVQGALSSNEGGNKKGDPTMLGPALRPDLAELEARNATLHEEIEGLQADARQARHREEELRVEIENLRQTVKLKNFMSL